jgi:hypothetical protein
MTKSPVYFEEVFRIVSTPSSRLEPLQMTNKGLRITLPLALQTDEGVIAVLTDCFLDFSLSRRIGIRIFHYHDPDDNCYIWEASALCTVKDTMLEQAQVKTIYLATKDVYL